jgi:ABC-type metal ion transport system substrate-binding protein
MGPVGLNGMATPVETGMQSSPRILQKLDEHKRQELDTQTERSLRETDAAVIRSTSMTQSGLTRLLGRCENHHPNWMARNRLACTMSFPRSEEGQ